MLQQFADGRIELGPITLFHEMYRERMWTYYNRQEWESLAKAVIQGNTNIDLDWYYLARSAEGLGLDKAAKIYYINALSTIHKCHRSSGYSYNDDCHGFNFPEAINARLEALR
ncbi:MAG: hypothetical protein ACRESZ_20530 [Methylococcales bacterium]